MRALLPGFILLSLSGCALWLPSPDPDQAWVDLKAHGATELQAVAVDDRPLRDTRYFQVEPGAHQLGMRYRFEVSPSDIGGDSQPLERTCRLQLDYADFTAGSRYRLDAGRHGFRPWAKLYDEQGQLLGRAEEKGCGDV